MNDGVKEFWIATLQKKIEKEVYTNILLVIKYTYTTIVSDSSGATWALEHTNGRDEKITDKQLLIKTKDNNTIDCPGIKKETEMDIMKRKMKTLEEKLDNVGGDF